MAASTVGKKGAELSKAEYLKRYLSGDEGDKKAKDKLKKKRRKIAGKGWVFSGFPAMFSGVSIQASWRLLRRRCGKL